MHSGCVLQVVHCIQRLALVPESFRSASARSAEPSAAARYTCAYMQHSTQCAHRRVCHCMLHCIACVCACTHRRPRLAKVDEPHAVVGTSEQHILELEVTVAHAALLAVRDGRGELCKEAARALGRQRAALRHNLVIKAVGDEVHDRIVHLGLRARARAFDGSNGK